MSERALIDEVMTLVVAGHETTASGLNWAWYLLAKHPDVDARMHAEIESTPELTAPGLGQMEELRYTQSVVNEALRRIPRAGCSPGAASRRMYCRALRFRRAPMYC